LIFKRDYDTSVSYETESATCYRYSFHENTSQFKCRANPCTRDQGLHSTMEPQLQTEKRNYFAPKSRHIFPNLTSFAKAYIPTVPIFTHSSTYPKNLFSPPSFIMPHYTHGKRCDQPTDLSDLSFGLDSTLRPIYQAKNNSYASRRRNKSECEHHIHEIIEAPTKGDHIDQTNSKGSRKAEETSSLLKQIMDGQAGAVKGKKRAWVKKKWSELWDGLKVASRSKEFQGMCRN
jgi:hypothetical protein